jgi:type I restriction enzyme S subunit
MSNLRHSVLDTESTKKDNGSGTSVPQSMGGVKTPLPKGYKQTEIGVIPEEWDAITLKTYSNLLMSNVDKKTNEEETSVALCNYMDVYRNNYITSNIDFMKATASELQIKNFTLQIGDIMITKDSETKSDIARASVVIEQLENVLCGYHLALIKPNPSKFDSIFLTKLFELTIIRKQLINKANGTTRFGLNVATIENLMIPLPPLPEQQKIAEILSTVDQKIDSIDSKIEETQTLKRGLMQRLLSEGIGHSEFKESEIGRIPTGWEVVKLKTLSTLIKDGTHGTHKEDPHGIPLLSAKDINNGKITFDNTPRLISIEDFNTIHKNYVLKDKDILITVVGTLGRVAIVKNYSNNYTFQRSVAIIRLKENCHIQFYFQVFNSLNFQQQLILKSNASAQAGVYLGELEKLNVPLPPLEEQKQITEILSTTDEKLETLRAKKEAFETLKKGLMQKLLSGEVRVAV